MFEFRRREKRSLNYPKTSSPVVSEYEDDSMEPQAGSDTEVTYTEVVNIECDVEIL